MDFKQAEIRFKQFKAQFEVGTLSETEFKTQLEELMIQDEQGSWWMIGYETELWYRHNGTNWVQTDLPGGLSLKSTPVAPPSEIVNHKSLENVARGQTEHEAALKAEREAMELVSRKKAEREVAEKAEAEREAKPKVVVDSVFREGLAQIPLATLLIMIGLSNFGFSLSGLSAIFAFLAGIFMIFRRKILSNRFFIYSLLIYLVLISLLYFVPLGIFYQLSGLLAILVGGSLFWYIFNPKYSSYSPLPYSSIAFALLLFTYGLYNFGMYFSFIYILQAALGLLTAFLIFKRK